MRARLGPDAAGSFQELRYGEPLGIGGATVRLAPAGHILGSAQVVIEHRGQRAVVSGDYKRRARSDGGALRAGALRPVRHRGDLRPAGVPPRARCARDRPAARFARGIPRAHASRRRLWARQDPAADRAAARRRLRPADLAARRARRPCATSTASSASISGELALVSDAPNETAGRDRAVPALGAEGPLVAPPDRSRHRLRLGLDARAGARPPVRRRAAAGHLRSCRLARADRTPSPRPEPRRSGSRTAARTRWCIRSA